jgi:hypothetical protein
LVLPLVPVLPLVLVLAGLAALLVVTRRRDWRIPALSASF